MRKYSVIVFALVLSFLLIGCSKKQQSLEEMQQPMSPEDLSRIKTQEDQAAVEATTNLAVSGAKTASNPEGKSEALPPSGPFKPTDKQIQQALKNAGYYQGAIDGKIGPKSKKAIEEFQRVNSLEADGKVGPKTWAVLVNFLNVQPSSDTQ